MRSKVSTFLSKFDTTKDDVVHYDVCIELFSSRSYERRGSASTRAWEVLRLTHDYAIVDYHKDLRAQPFRERSSKTYVPSFM
jgi:hypothetical protein